MFLVTWIEGEEVNYRLVKKHEVPSLIKLGHNVIVQQLDF